ncbi:hypothetical protein [Tenacibaculum sp. UWU-22]|uniref:hypothetical protein n=1 Tax=Tenacibaculum sp. UWU-22 TaxID=3234187 RepID=UPI0034DACCC3
MLTILTQTNQIPEVKKDIETVYRLSELVTVTSNLNQIDPNTELIKIENNSILLSLDWFDTAPPYIFSEIPLNQKNLLAIVFYKLGNYDKALTYVEKQNYLHHQLQIAINLQLAYPISEADFVNEKRPHNQCIIQHYGNYIGNTSVEELKKRYKTTINQLKNDELKAYTVKCYNDFLLDNNLFKQVKDEVHLLENQPISLEAKNALLIQLAYALMAELELPYDIKKLEKIAALFAQGIQFFEEKKLTIQAGLLLIDASEIANYQNNYISSKDLINKAIAYFKDAEIPAFLAEASLRKATLLYTWSKNGNPQYYKPAINAFQDTLKIVKRDTHPQKFADIHHTLAIIYSEIPVSEKEKAIWAAFCASSFNEALQFYTKEKYPYQYAMINHNYATALIHFPEAKLHNNLNKSHDMFEEALAIRTPEQYPFERSMSLLNQLELYWLMHNQNNIEEEKKYAIMLNKANEIKQLVTDAALIEKANEHLNALKKLKTILN